MREVLHGNHNHHEHFPHLIGEMKWSLSFFEEFFTLFGGIPWVFQFLDPYMNKGRFLGRSGNQRGFKSWSLPKGKAKCWGDIRWGDMKIPDQLFPSGKG